MPDHATTLASALSERTSCPVPVLAHPPVNWPDASPLAVAQVDTPDHGEAERLLAALPGHVDLVGRRGPGDTRLLAVLTQEQPFAEPVPDSFTVLAIMPAYNEADIVVGSVQGLLDQGVDVHVLDNWSTDGTPELLAAVSGRGRLTVERFPDASAPVRYEWEAILRRVEQVARDSGATWCVLHDIDERRTGPWPDRDLRASLFEVDRRGYTAVDHTVWEYHPVDNGFTGPQDDLVATLRHWAPPQVGANRTQVKAWRVPEGDVDLAGSGGHEVSFEGRRLFPYNFLLQHYPIRSQEHGERKVLIDRKPRFSASERRRLWHRHYDHIRTGHDFLWSPAELFEDTPECRDELLVERITGRDPTAPVATAGARRRAASALAKSGLRPAFVSARRRVRIVRRRNPETGRR